MSHSKRSPRAFEVENPGYYRLSQDLRHYQYPSYLGIQSVRLCPSCDFQYSSVDWNVEVLVTIDGREHRVHIYTPQELCPGGRARVVPTNCVVVPVIDGGSVAHAVSLIVRQGLESPRDSRMLGSAAKPFPDVPINALKARIGAVLRDWKLVGEDGEPTRRMSSIMSCITRTPYLKAIDLVESLLGQQLDLSREQYHDLAEEIFAVYREFAKDLFVYRREPARGEMS